MVLLRWGLWLFLKDLWWYFNFDINLIKLFGNLKIFGLENFMLKVLSLDLFLWYILISVCLILEFILIVNGL